MITLLLASTLGIITPNVSAKANNAKWTIMMYVAADNNLDPYSTMDINELEMVGSSDDVNIVAMLDLYYEKGTWIYYIEQDDNPDEITSSTVAEWSEMNTGDGATLEKFVRFVTRKFPAERNVLVLWDHGSSFIGVCWDEHTGIPDLAEDHLTHEEIVEALSGFDLEVLAFDACIQAYIEVAYEYSVAKKTDIEYLVGSEGFVPLMGNPYDMILGNLTQNPDVSTEDFLVSWTNAYAYFYQYVKRPAEVVSTTLSAIKVDLIDEVVTGLRTLTESLVENMNEETYDLIAAARGEGMMPWGIYGWGGALIDLVSFVEYLSASDIQEATALGGVLDEAIVSIGNTICMESTGTGGLGIFFPASYNSFINNPWWWVGWGEYYEDTKFAAEGWMDFLYAFYSDYHG